MKKQIIIMFVALISIGVIGFVLWNQTTSAEPLTEESAKKLADERYGGEITTIQLVDNEFHIKMNLPTGMYQLKINRINGDVISMEQVAPTGELTEEEIRQTLIEEESSDIQQIEKKIVENRTYYEVKMESIEGSTVLLIDAHTGGVIERQEVEKQPNDNKKKNQISKQQAKSITEAEAKQIALETVDPKRMSEVDDVDLEEVDGQIYYFVEVEFEEGHDAFVQIHAITGEVKSIEWDD